MGNENIGSMIVILGIAVIIFFLCRELFVWYFKINERADLQRENNELLKLIYKQLGGEIKDKEVKKTENLLDAIKRQNLENKVNK